MPLRPWAILLCHASDVPPGPGSALRWSKYLTHYPVDPGSAFAYWADMLGGIGDMEGSRVFGWYDMGLTRQEIWDQSQGNGRADMINLGRQVAGVDTSRFAHTIVVVNVDANAGQFGGVGVLFSHPDAAPNVPTFECHELGHEFGLDHSFGEGAQPCAGGDARPGAYCDPWDIMSAMVVHSFLDANGQPNGPGLNGPNLDRLGAVRASRLWRPRKGWFVRAELLLGDLRNDQVGDFSIATFVAPSMDSSAADFGKYSMYYLEYRHPDPAGWDRALPNDAVLVHEVRFADGLDRLLTNTNGGQLQAGQPFSPPQNTVTVQLNGIDAAGGTASVDIVGTVPCKMMARSSRMVLDVPGGSQLDGVPMQSWPDNGGANQHWLLVPASNGYYNVVSRASGKVLDVRGGPSAIADGVVIQQWSNLGGTNQEWNVSFGSIDEVTGEISFVLVARSSGKALTVVDIPFLSFPAPIVQEELPASGPALNQEWYLMPVRSTFKIVSRSSGKVLDVQGGPSATGDGAPIQQWSDIGGTNQKWSLLPTGDRYFWIESVSSGKVLDVTGGPGATGNGVPIQQWSALAGGTNQQWQLVPTGGGFVKIVSRSSGKVLEVTGGPAATGDGVPIDQWLDWSDVGGSNQEWQLVPTDS